jgi:clostripain
MYQEKEVKTMPKFFSPRPPRLWIPFISGLILATWLACGGGGTPAQSSQANQNQPDAVTPAQASTESSQAVAVAPTQAAQPPTASGAAVSSAPTTAPEPAANQPAAQGQAEWTVMLYQDADDEILEQDIMIDFNEAELIGSTPQVNIVAQVDRYDGAFRGMGDWTSAKRFYLTRDNNLGRIGSEELEDLGEVNMADGRTLVDFITWSVRNFPARKYALIMSDHGAGWPGGWNDPNPGGLGPDRVAVAQLFGVDGLWLMELDKALEQARAQAKINKFEMIGFDACLMGQLEVFTALEPHARYAVASQEVEPALGWAYAGFLLELTKNPAMDGEKLSGLIVQTYIDQDMRILDPQARQQLLAQEFNFYGEASPEEVAQAKGKDTTLTAVKLSAIPQVNQAVDSLTTALVGIKPKAVAQARAYAQSFQSIFGEEVPSPYIDLGHFLQLMIEVSGNNEKITAAAQQVAQALLSAIIAEKHGEDRSGATGFTIYFPTSEIYNAADNVGYTTVAQRFARVSKWDDFLTAYYTGRPAQQFNRPDETPPVQTSAPAQIQITQAELAQLQADITFLQFLGYAPNQIPEVLVQEGGYPAELIQALIDNGYFSGSRTSRSAATRWGVLGIPKPIEVAPIQLSAEVAQPGAPVTIKTQISSSDQLAYVYSFIGRFLPRQDVLLIEDIDYIISDESQQILGTTYPVWPEGGFEVEYEWEPTVYAISDGQTSVKALFDPAAYDVEQPTYSVNGIYRPADGQERFAKISFQNDVMTKIIGFTSGITQAIGAPRQILAQPGDKFTVLERGDDLSQGEAGREAYVREGGTLTFSDQPFTLVTTPAPSGNYVVGIIAEDLDGQTYEQYEGLFVVNPDASSVDGFGPYVNEALGLALLYPEQWQVEENVAEGTVDFFDEAGSAQVNITRTSYPDAADAAAANSQAVQDVIDTLSQQGDLENLQFVTDVEDYVLGAFDAQVVDFAFDLDGQPYYGYAVASTPVDDATYVILVSSLDADFDNLAPLFDDMLYSFDILISGVSKEQAGPPPPDFASQTFNDDFSQPDSGLINDQEEQPWGRGYYTDAGQYLLALKPNPGTTYDYYANQTLEDEFLIQATASYTGALDNGYGLLFRVQVGEEADEFYTFRISGDGFYTVEKTENGELQPAIDWIASNLINQAEGEANVLAVEGRGDTYSLYINGRQVNTFSDTSYSGGTFGFIVDNYDSENPANFSFDDLTAGTPAQP